MSAPRFALIRRQLRQLSGITARRVTVRTAWPWYWRALLWTAVLSVSLVLANWLYDTGRRFAGFDSETSGREIHTLRERVATLERELSELRSVSHTADSRLQVEKTTQEELVAQVRVLQRDNAALKDELSLFEGFASGGGGQAIGLSLVRVALDAVDVAAGRYRYRVLLVNRSAGRSGAEVRGELQFELQIELNGKNASIRIPGGDHTEAARHRVTVKHFHRAEGELAVPAGAVLKGGEVRLLQDGQIKARQALAL